MNTIHGRRSGHVMINLYVDILGMISNLKEVQSVKVLYSMKSSDFIGFIPSIVNVLCFVLVSWIVQTIYSDGNDTYFVSLFGDTFNCWALLLA